jgi:hypothetical protein
MGLNLQVKQEERGANSTSPHGVSLSFSFLCLNSIENIAHCACQPSKDNVVVLQYHL